MKKKLVVTTGAIALMTLANCGSNGDGKLISAEEELLRVFADTDGDGLGNQDFADVLDADGELVARRVSLASWREDYPGNGSYMTLDGTLRIQGDGDDLLVTVDDGNGTLDTIRIVDARSITASNVTIDNGDLFFDMFVGNGLEIGDLLDSSVGNGYAFRVGVYYTNRLRGNEFGSELRAVMGAETQDAMIGDLHDASATASYSGFGAIDVRRADAGWNIYNGNISGDVDMTADFGASTISGAMSNLFYEERAGSTVTDSYGVAGSILMDEAKIKDNAFKGTLSADAALAADDDGIATVAGSVGYSGAFYGPQAEEVGGTFQGSGSFEGTDYLASGAFTANID